MILTLTYWEKQNTLFHSIFSFLECILGMLWLSIPALQLAGSGTIITSIRTSLGHIFSQGSAAWPWQTAIFFAIWWLRSHTWKKIRAQNKAINKHIKSFSPQGICTPFPFLIVNYNFFFSKTGCPDNIISPEFGAFLWNNSGEKVVYNEKTILYIGLNLLFLFSSGLCSSQVSPCPRGRGWQSVITLVLLGHGLPSVVFPSIWGHCLVK